MARLATESGLFPVFEAEAGEVTSSTPIRRQVPVTDYLRIQARYAHLFKPEEKTEFDVMLDSFGANKIEVSAADPGRGRSGCIARSRC